MTYPAMTCLSAVLAMAAITAHAQSTQSDAEHGRPHAETRPHSTESGASTTALPDPQSDTASLLPLTQPSAGHISELAQLKAVTLLAVLPYFNSLAQLAQLPTVEKESLVLRLQADIGQCETPTCLVRVQMELNRILMDRVMSLYKNVSWVQPKAFSEPSRN